MPWSMGWTFRNSTPASVMKARVSVCFEQVSKEVKTTTSPKVAQSDLKVKCGAFEMVGSGMTVPEAAPWMLWSVTSMTGIVRTASECSSGKVFVVRVWLTSGLNDTLGMASSSFHTRLNSNIPDLFLSQVLKQRHTQMYRNMFSRTPLFIATGFPSSNSTPDSPPSPAKVSMALRISSSASAMVFWYFLGLLDASPLFVDSAISFDLFSGV